MTLGERIKEARKQCGLTQKQLAEKMQLSGASIAEWEEDKALPDTANLKALAQLLNVSVDDLLNSAKSAADSVVREAYKLSDYGKGSRKNKKNRLIRERFPDALIHPLLGKQKLTKGEKVLDNVLGFATEAFFGLPDVVHGVRNMDKEFYLVEKSDRQFFVTVSDEFIETRRLTKHIAADKFEIGNWKFTKCRYELR
ncbi:MAG: helix-turn-helix domain-containing protein [Bacillota bacterium]|nr:helix-turn-helix domain-containing protein [Bacillota bacterium]